MQVRVVPFPPYRAGLGAEPIELELPPRSTLRELLRRLAARSREFGAFADARGDEWLWGQLLVHRRGEIVRLDHTLEAGDCLELLPPIAGGAA